MPKINQFKCDACTFSLPSGWGGIAYIEGYEGQRVILPHPGEHFTAERVLNLHEGTLTPFWAESPRWWWSKKRKNAYDEKKAIRDDAFARSGFLSDCVCGNCFNIQRLDLARDKRVCSSCSSENIKSTKELLGGVCPKCKKGTIIEIDTGSMS